MAEIAYDRFEGGLDRRYNRPVGGANILWVLKNAYITTGKKIKKRPCFVRVATLESGTKGLKAAGGVLNTFYGQGTVTHANALFRPNKVAHPTLAIDVAKAHFAEMFNGFLYASVEYTNGDVKHHYLDGTVPTHVADVNCPNTKQVVKLSQKIYAKSGGDVRFCATALPRNWTIALDAGSISSATNAAGSDVVTALGNFNGDLAIFFSDGIQVWHVDPNPALNSLKSSSNSAGTVFAKAGQTLAQDFVFLAKPGFRSLSVAVLTSNLQENDVGSAIDKLRSEIADTDDPTVIYFPALGQLLCFNGTKVYAYSFSRSNKLSAWSTFEFPFTVDDVAVLNSELYARAGDIVYRFDVTAFVDDAADIVADRLTRGAGPFINLAQLLAARPASPVGKIYTFSVWIRSEGANRSGVLTLSDTFVGGIFTTPFTATSTFQRFSITSAGPWNPASIQMAVGISQDSAGSVIIYGAQLEEGAVATAYEKTTSSPGARNLLLFSEQFDNASWFKDASVSVTANVDASPNFTIPLVEVEMFFQDGKSPGIEKMFIGFDAVVTGTPKVAFRYDPRDETLITPFIPISSDTRPADLYPMDLCATSIAPVWNHQANEDFRLDQMLLYYEKLGAV